MKNILLLTGLFVLILGACSTSQNEERPEGIARKDFAIYEVYTVAELAGAFASIESLSMEDEHTDDTIVNSQMVYRPHPLFEKLTMVGEGVIALVRPRDTAFVGEYLRVDSIRALFPRELKFAWSATMIDAWEDQNDEKGFFLYALKIPGDGARIANEHIQSAQAEYNEQNGQQIVGIRMTDSGSERWEKMTSDNIGHCLAITVNGVVFSCPKVMGSISGGRTEISGHFTVDEAKELAWAIRP